MHAFATVAGHLPGVAAAGLPALLAAAAALAVGLGLLRAGLTPLEPILGRRLHGLLGGAMLGLFAAWVAVSAVWLLGLSA